MLFTPCLDGVVHLPHLHFTTFTRDAEFALDLQAQGIFTGQWVHILFGWNVQSYCVESHQQPVDSVGSALNKGYSDHPGHLLLLWIFSLFGVEDKWAAPSGWGVKSMHDAYMPILAWQVSSHQSQHHWRSPYQLQGNHGIDQNGRLTDCKVKEATEIWLCPNNFNRDIVTTMEASSNNRKKDKKIDSNLDCTGWAIQTVMTDHLTLPTLPIGSLTDKDTGSESHSRVQI